MFGVGVLVYSIVIGVLVSYDGFMLSSVKSGGCFVPVVRFTLSKFGDGEWVFGGGFARSHEKSLSPGPESRFKALVAER